MTYIRKYEFDALVNSDLATLYSIVIWEEPYTRKTKDNEIIEFPGHWMYIYRCTYVSIEERDQVFNDLIQNGIYLSEFKMINAGLGYVQLDPPNETDIQIKDIS